MEHEGAGLPYPPQPGHTAIPQDQGGLPYPPQPGHTAVPQDQGGLPYPPQPGYNAVPQDKGGLPYPPQPGYNAVPQYQAGLSYQPQPGYNAAPQDKAGLPYSPQPGFTAVPQDQGNENSDPRQYQPQGQPVPDPQNFQPAAHMSAVPNVPPGLEYLIQVDQVLIHQKRHSVFQSNLEYEILNAVSQRMYYAQQERECCGPQLDVRIYNNSQQHILHLLLPLKYCSWETELEVYSPTTGSLIGYIVKNWTAFSISFSILNTVKECVLKVLGPGFSMAGFSDVNFEVKTADESQAVGRITKVWRGLQKEMFSANDHYSVQFPMNLDAKVKALLMSTGIFIDYLYYEARNRNNQMNHRMNHPVNHHMNHHMNDHINHHNIHMNPHNHHMNHHNNHMNHHMKHHRHQPMNHHRHHR